MRGLFRFIKRPRLFALGIFCFIFLIAFCNYSNYVVKSSAEGKLFSELNEIPYNEVGLVLGTSKYLSGNYLNPYFVNRLDAAAQLYFAEKIDHIIVSGDNSKKNYDEPTDMMNYLIEKGIPAENITRDYAGFRTFDSMVRALKVFGQKKLTIISQEFHNERALFICNHIGIDAVAFNAKEVYRGPASKWREYFAKTKAYLDIYLLGQEPKFLGKEEKIMVQN